MVTALCHEMVYVLSSLQEKKWLMVSKLVLQDGSLRDFLWTLTIGIRAPGKEDYIEMEKKLATNSVGKWSDMMFDNNGNAIDG